MSDLRSRVYKYTKNAEVMNIEHKEFLKFVLVNSSARIKDAEVLQKQRVENLDGCRKSDCCKNAGSVKTKCDNK